jgi:2-polyprenyl-6-methoxyphenol hydroxylase-like FAD-dependent oxidoreductase
MDIAEKMGVLADVEAMATGTDIIEAYREGHDRRYVIEIGRLMSAVSDRHVEIMRDDLSQILYDACGDRVDFRFGESIAQIAEHTAGVDVAFESGPSERFDLVIGADGLHSNVRRLVFGSESDFTTWIGAYLAVASIPNYLELRDRTVMTCGVDRMAGLYSSAQMADARAIFLFRPRHELDYDHRDVIAQKLLLRKAFDGFGPHVTRLLDEVQCADAFYLDSITQLRMDSWSRGRVSLVGDAGYCPGPAVGGSTSLAVVGAYVLAGELAVADGDHTRAFAAYEMAMADYVIRSREFAIGAAKRLLPSSPWGVWAFIGTGLLVGHLPVAVTQALTKVTPRTVRLHDAVTVKDYESSP